MPTTKKRLRARVNVGRGADGKAIYRWASGFTEAELEESKRQLKAEYDADQQRAASAQLLCGDFDLQQLLALVANAPHAKQQETVQTPSFEAYALEWFDLYKRPKLRQSSVDMYLNVLNAHLIPAIGRRPMGEITSGELQRLILTYAGKSKSLIDKVAMTIRQIFAAAVDDGTLKEDPSRRLKPPRGSEGERLPVPFEDVAPLTKALIRHKDGALPLLLLYTGLRRGEALGLRWDDITNGEVTVRRQAVLHVNQAVIGDTKTKAAHRSVPVPDFVLRQLGTPGDGYVFGVDHPYSQSVVKRLFERLARDIPQMQGVSPHRLRHTYTMLMRRAGVDPATMQYLLGHEDYETTANVYTHIDRADLSTARTQLTTLTQSLVPSVATKTVAT